jgi:hypothetical protein
MIHREKIANVIERDGRVIWSPLPRFTALGMVETDVGPIGHDGNAEHLTELFRRARLARKSAREARALARADRIRAAYA